MYLIIDTEGKDYLSEIAILDHNGKLIYEAFSTEHSNNAQRQFNLKPLIQILQDLTQIAQAKTIICHYAEHDLTAIANSY